MPQNALMGARLFALILLVAACASPPRAPAPIAGDCEIIRLWSNGFHTNIALRGETLADDHPLRALFPDASHFLVGWGERDYYMASDATFSMGVKAIFPPSASVVHVIAANEPVEARLWPGEELLDIAVSRAGARRLGSAIADSIARDASGAPIRERDGRVESASAFLRSPQGFHLFNMCNHWTARALRESGVRINPATSFTAGGLVNAVRRKSLRTCPTTRASVAFLEAASQ